MGKLFPFFIIFSISSIIFYSCGGPASLYNFEYPLTNEVVKSGKSELSVALPREWYIAESNRFELWLVKNDLSNTIIFQVLNLDDKTKSELGKDPIPKLISYSKTFRSAKLGEKFVDLKKDELFELNGRKFGAYEYADNKGYRKRVVLFKYNDNYYEVTTAVKPPIQEANVKEIFAMQNSILKSIK